MSMKGDQRIDRALDGIGALINNGPSNAWHQTKEDPLAST
jgi:hypothetical protein